MDPDVSTRPKKRRRTKGGRPLQEDDADAADGIAIRSVIYESESGPVETRSAVPVWINQPGPIAQTSTPAEGRPPIPAGEADLFDRGDGFDMADEPDVARPSKVTWSPK
jgi:hypothetical protein